MKSAIPESVSVGPYRYTVRVQPGLRSGDGAKADGLAKHGTTLIEIEESQGAIPMKETLLHEVLHAICSTIGLWEHEKTYTEESFIRHTTAMLLDTMRRNPDLVHYLMEEI